MAESTPLENLHTEIDSKQCSYFKMKVLKSLKAEEIDKTVEAFLDKRTIEFSDDSTSYTNLGKLMESHYPEKSNEQTTKTTLKWVHIAMNNAKRMFDGVFHKMNGKYLQNYLDEFCYKLNRRFFGVTLFERVTLAVAKFYW
jgi:hypothetical protein